MSEAHAVQGAAWSLAVHGGAGAARDDGLDPKREDAIRAALAAVLSMGARLLTAGAASLDVVEQAVRALEDSPLFNAGRGAVLTAAGTVELEASIMNGSDGSAGAVAVLRGVKNPVTLARQVMERTRHVFLAGEGATAFARTVGVELAPEDYFLTPERRRAFEAAKRGGSAEAAGSAVPGGGGGVGTVGAVALDLRGHLASATSTGGMWGKMPGRIADSSVIGAGTYARDGTCAVSCTGHGEFFLRNTVARDITAAVERGLDLRAALDDVIGVRLAALRGSGGAIAVDARGTAICAFNSELMHRGIVTHAQPELIGIYRGEAP